MKSICHVGEIQWLPISRKLIHESFWWFDLWDVASRSSLIIRFLHGVLKTFCFCPRVGLSFPTDRQTIFSGSISQLRTDVNKKTSINQNPTYPSVVKRTFQISCEPTIASGNIDNFFMFFVNLIFILQFIECLAQIKYILWALFTWWKFFSLKNFLPKLESGNRAIIKLHFGEPRLVEP